MQVLRLASMSRAARLPWKRIARLKSNEVGIFTLDQSQTNVYGKVETISNYTQNGINYGYAAIQEMEQTKRPLEQLLIFMMEQLSLRAHMVWVSTTLKLAI